MLTIHYKTTGKKSFIYRVKGTAAELKQYREDKTAEGALVEDEDTGSPLFFISKNADFQPSGTPIVRKEGDDGDVRYWPHDTEEAILMRQALQQAALKKFGISAGKQSDTESEREPNLESPAPKAAKTRRGIK